MADNFGGASSGSALFPSDDGLAKIADLFVNLSGKELTADGVQMLMFLRQNGSADLAAEIMTNKVYMSSPSDLKNFIEKLSPAQHAKDMIETQARVRAETMR